MHRLHIAYTSKVYFAATSSPWKQTAGEQWKLQQRAWLHTRLYRRSRRTGTEGSGWARRLLRACNQLRFCTILTRAVINMVSWLTSSSCRRSSSSCWWASHPLKDWTHLPDSPVDPIRGAAMPAEAVLLESWERFEEAMMNFFSVVFFVFAWSYCTHSHLNYLRVTRSREINS